MTNTEADVEIDLCPPEQTDGVQILDPRSVPLGGPRAMTVRRTLPHRERSFVGAWCFVDHYGPDDVAVSGGMDVPPHPHTGLQTVSWLFQGNIEHRDTGGVHAAVMPGELNLMTGGRGIAHSEVSTPDTCVLHGVQLWVVLPEADRDMPRDFQHFPTQSRQIAPGIHARVFIGELGSQASPVRTATPLLGAELEVESGAWHSIDVDPSFEHAVLVDRGSISFCGSRLTRGQLGIVDPGRRDLVIAAAEDARIILLGGTPFDEEVVMWWNFIASTHEAVARARQEWQDHSDRFGEVHGYRGPSPRLDAPPMPGVRLRPRGRTGRNAR